MATFEVLSATLRMCLVGTMTVTGGCPDGYPPDVTDVVVLHGTGPEACFLPPVVDCVTRLESIIEIRRNDKVLFILKPDGKVERDPAFSNDEAAKAFWEAVLAALPPGWAK